MTDPVNPPSSSNTPAGSSGSGPVNPSTDDLNVFNAQMNSIKLSDQYLKDFKSGISSEVTTLLGSNSGLTADHIKGSMERLSGRIDSFSGSLGSFLSGLPGMDAKAGEAILKDAVGELKAGFMNALATNKEALTPKKLSALVDATLSNKDLEQIKGELSNELVQAEAEAKVKGGEYTMEDVMDILKKNILRQLIVAMQEKQEELKKQSEKADPWDPY